MRTAVRNYLFSLIFVLIFIFLAGQVKTNGQALALTRVNVQIVADEAEAVLRIMAKRERSEEITEADWQAVFFSEGYVRLKKRELSMSRPFDDADFKSFALSDAVVQRRPRLAETLAQWKSININHPAELALAYLPARARIRAKIYPVIKPRENSFVFDIPDDPAIFLFLDPTVSREKFENTLAHELHHIGFGSACPSPSTSAKIKTYSPAMQRVLKWIAAFGEGFAMLAAAGGPDIHPHRYSPIEDKQRWDKDVANFDQDRRMVERFFLDLAGGRISEADENKTAGSFYGVQGPWYTVGWQMAVVLEKTFGRKKFIQCMCDQRKLLATYNRAVKIFDRRNHLQLTGWDRELIRRFK